MPESELNYAAFAVPIFLVAVVIEALISRKREGYYAFGTAISDLACGSVFQAVEVLFKIFTFGAYIWLYENVRLVDWAEGHWAPWVLAFVGVDLLFYWWHRASHVVNWLWAVHGVHHQSEDFNLAVALRQPTFEPITWFFFYAPLALLGVDPMLYVLAYAVNRFYQFWIHTELVRRVGPLEWILNTPSHHRVHHGVNEQYLDKNYGAILILWDRLFGTFENEEERVVYGTTVPLASYNPVWANFSIFARIGRVAASAKGIAGKLWAPFAHPAWLPTKVDPDEGAPKRLEVPKYRPEISNATMLYVSLHFALVGAAMFGFLLYESQWNLAQLIAGGAVLVLSSATFTGLIEAKPWARFVEGFRLIAFFVVLAWLGSAKLSGLVFVIALGALGLACAGGLWLYRGHALRSGTPT